MRRLLWISLVTLAALSPAGCGRDEAAHPSGTFEAIEIDLSPRLAGQLVRVGPREGDHVNQGDTLLVVDTELIRRQRAEAAAALVVTAARRHVATDRRDQQQRELELAEVTLGRLEIMNADGNATDQRLDEARAQRDIAARRLDAAKHELQVLDAEAERLRATVAVADRKIEDGILTAPVDGTILLRPAEPGEMAAPGRTVLRLADLTRLELRFYLEEQDLDLVRLGGAVPVAVDALPDRAFTGTVTWISDEAEFTPKNAQTRDARAQLVYAVKLTVDNPDGVLHIGMPAEIELPR
ncbi:MAG: efflux RND transporter periplasmic adaptor subunit [Candidatus Eiseniibacteriota bacterium]|jgi:HlyD family secretion protein